MFSIKARLFAIMCLLMATSLFAGQKESFVWTVDSTDKRIQILSSFDMNSRGQVWVALFDFSSGARFLIRSIASAEAGSIRCRIEDDSSDWWLESEMSFGKRFVTMREMSNYSPRPGKGKITHSFRANGLELARAYNYQIHLGREISERFMASASTDEDAILFAEDIPRDLQEAILILDQIDTPEATWRFDELIGAIATWIRRSEAPPTIPPVTWELEKRAHEWGLGTMVTPEELEFTSRFKSIDNADPLAGFRPEELFPEE